MQSPVLLIAFNRPHTTAQVFDAIRKAQPPRLYVAVDGPRPDRPHEIDLCNQVREIVSQVDWPCTLATLFRTSNLGCRDGATSAIDWFFEHEPEGIILEDDCLPHPDFFRYCDELLARYRDNPRIMTIGGSNLLPDSDTRPESYFYTPYFHVWGWASWRRAWALYDVSMKSYKAANRNQMLKNIFGHNISIRTYWRRKLDSVAAGKGDIWDYQWVLDCLSHGGLTCLPGKNLISNIGFGEDATHTREMNTDLAQRRTASISFPLIAPASLDCDPQLTLAVEKAHFSISRNITIKSIRKFTKIRIRDLLGLS